VTKLSAARVTAVSNRRHRVRRSNHAAPPCPDEEDEEDEEDGEVAAAAAARPAFPDGSISARQLATLLGTTGRISFTSRRSARVMTVAKCVNIGSSSTVGATLSYTGKTEIEAENTSPFFR
jgi:hypothetical protein